MLLFLERLLTLAGGPLLRTAWTALGCLVLLSRGRVRDAILLASSVASTSMLNSAIKKIVARGRPARASSGGYSFPSGHTSGILALFVAGTHLYRRSAGERAAQIASLALMPLVVAVGWSRIGLQEHHPFDVAGGAALGCGVAWGIVYLFERVAPPRSRRHNMG